MSKPDAHTIAMELFTMYSRRCHAIQLANFEFVAKSQTLLATLGETPAREQLDDALLETAERWEDSGKWAEASADEWDSRKLFKLVQAALEAGQQ